MLTPGGFTNEFLKSKYMKELIELKKHYEQELKKAEADTSLLNPSVPIVNQFWIASRTAAFLEFVERLDLILNNSVVKPSERRSPTDESFNGCKPPERKAKSTEDKDKCEHLVERAIGQQGELFVCRKCGEHGQHLSIYWA